MAVGEEAVANAAVTTRPWGLARRLLLGGTGRAGADALLSFVVRVGGAALTFASQALAARWMAVDEFGAFSNGWIWATLAAVVAQLGLATTSTRFACAYRALGDPGRLRGLLVFSQSAALVLGLLSAAVVAFLATAPYLGFTAPQREALLVAALCIPVLAQIDVGRGLARITGLAAVAYAPGMLLRPALFLLGLCGLILSGLVVDATSALLAMLAALAGSWMAQLLLLWLRVRGLTARAKPVFEPRQWLTSSSGVVVTDVYLLFIASIDIILLNLLASPAAGALYFAAAKTTVLISYVLFAVSAVAQDRLATLWAQQDEKRLKWTALRLCDWAFWPTLAAATLLVAGGRFVLGLFGGEYLVASSVLPILAAAYVVQAAAGPVRILIVMTGHQNTLALILTGFGVGCLGLNLLLIPQFGVIGAALAFFATTVASTLAMVNLAHQRLGFWCVARTGKGRDPVEPSSDARE